ncbi:hypothetical protein RIF29_14835 [Crotalaria pallida]|uniref:Ribonuclease H1 N-terminal domain-containing protein n=1 Tax=Crotalaria pallida TaxID=3830 RepID=A0AAN9IC15_CROPI
MSTRYVVFEGRRHGIYDSWEKCKVQVDGFSGCLYKKYPSEDMAYATLEEYQRSKIEASNRRRSGSYGSSSKCQAQTSKADTNISLDELADVMSSIEPQYINNDEGKTSTIEFAEEHESDCGILNFSMQEWLQRITQTLGNTDPIYKRHDNITHGGILYCRYYAIINSSLIGETPLCMGRFAANDWYAREDAALIMMRRVLELHGKKILDFNYYNIKNQKHYVKCLESENFDLIVENAQLKEEIRHICEEELVAFSFLSFEMDSGASEQDFHHSLEANIDFRKFLNPEEVSQEPMSPGLEVEDSYEKSGPPEPTKAELLAMIEGLTKHIQELEKKLDNTNAAVKVLEVLVCHNTNVPGRTNTGNVSDVTDPVNNPIEDTIMDKGKGNAPVHVSSPSTEDAFVGTGMDPKLTENFILDNSDEDDHNGRSGDRGRTRSK